jgi:hypothetical protein
MSKKTCPMEKEVIKGLDEENMSLELQKHIAGCSICQDLVLVKGWMNRFEKKARETDIPEKTLPDAESIWQKAYARRRPDKILVQMALRPLIVPQVLFYGLLLAGIIYGTIWSIKQFGNILDSRVTPMILPFFGIIMFIVLISLSFCAIVAALDKRSIS